MYMYMYMYMYVTPVYTCSHSLVPVLPSSLVDYVQLPSTYIMGIHSYLRDKVEDDLVRSLSLSLSLSLPPSLSLPFPIIYATLSKLM